jgi:glycosyltransferase involved in cell wall biosynthesis
LTATTTGEVESGGGSSLRVAILGIKHQPASAGADRVVERLLEYLPVDHEYTIYVMRDGAPMASCSANKRYVAIPSIGGKHLRAFSYFLLCTLHYLARGRYDVAHVHNSDFGIFSPLLRLKRRVKVIGTFHGDPYLRGKWGRFARWYLRASEWCFVRSCDVLTSVAVSKTVRGHPIEYIANGVDTWEPPPTDSGFPYDELGLEKGRYVMFAAGRVDSTKGLHHLVRAYRQTHDPDAAHLLAVGDFSHDAAYASEIRDEAANDSRIVLFPRLLGREQLFEAIHHSSIFVFPSEVEGMSMMLLEAIGVGARVACSDIDENVAVVGSDYPFLFRVGDTASLQETLQHSLNAPSEPVAARLLQRVSRDFRWEKIAAEYEQLYNVR